MKKSLGNKTPSRESDDINDSEDVEFSELIVKWLFIPGILFIMLVVYLVLHSESDSRATSAIPIANYNGRPPARSNPNPSNKPNQLQTFPPLSKELSAAIGTDEFEVAMYLDFAILENKSDNRFQSEPTKESYFPRSAANSTELSIA